MVSSNNIDSLTFNKNPIEATSIPLKNRTVDTSSISFEAALKYLLLGIISSAFFLFGMVLYFSLSGSWDIRDSILVASQVKEIQISFAFILLALLLKLSVPPFHFFIPDLFEGASYTVLTYLSIVTKIGYFGLLLNFLSQLTQVNEYALATIPLITILISGIAAYRQTKIKRFLAYSSVSNTGFLLVPLLSFSTLGTEIFLSYLILYIMTTLSIIPIILSLKTRLYKSYNLIIELTSLLLVNPALCFAFSISFFSLAGIPPLAGFWGKFLVFMLLVKNNMWLPAIIIVLISTLAAYYYLRFIKTILFDSLFGLHTNLDKNKKNNPILYKNLLNSLDPILTMRESTAIYISIGTFLTSTAAILLYSKGNELLSILFYISLNY